MKEKLLKILDDFREDIKSASTIAEVDAIRVAYQGKKGHLKSILKDMGKLSKEDKPIIGKIANEIRDEIDETVLSKTREIKNAEMLKKIESEYIDITLPGTRNEFGAIHPTSKIIKRLTDIFYRMGFVLMDGPEIETVYNNFDALNAPKSHPSRDKSDTFYFDAETILRTHTSPVQIRTMMNSEPPIRTISIGRCFRNDEFDSTHSPMFYQMEGLVVEEGVTMGNLKSTLDTFARELFGEHTKTVFRPHNFPFTEPSAEVDVTCFKCEGEGCKFCSHTGYIEILGCGMVHPNVLEECGIDSEKYTGFAFGMGIDRITMMKYEIEDIRRLYENDIKFLEKFRR